MRYLAEARKNHGRLIEFKLHDVHADAFPTLAARQIIAQS
jgi:hypothetical protein